MDSEYPVEYIIYVDESGDHGLRNVNPQFPVFVLAFCIFKVTDYVEKVVPSMQRLKFRHFKHDMVILHERDIRRGSGYFSKLSNPGMREHFIKDLSLLVAESNFQIVCCVLDKRSLRRNGVADEDLYYLAARNGLEAVSKLLQNHVGKQKIPVVFESRGKQEDSLLRSEFEANRNSLEQWANSLPYELIIATKKVKSTGLQIADMVARPIAQAWLRPKQSNRAFHTVQAKLETQVVIG